MQDQDPSRRCFSVALPRLFQIVKILREFEENKDKKFNFSRLAEVIEIPPESVDKIMELILQFQELFDTLGAHELALKKQGTAKYFVTIKKEMPIFRDGPASPPERFALALEEAAVLNDIVYLFKQVRRGMGFDLSREEGSTRIRKLFEGHPYLFFKNGNDLYYPSELAVSIGQKLLSYRRANRDLTELGEFTINNILVKIGSD